jgi:hypothetical protein
MMSNVVRLWTEERLARGRFRHSLSETDIFAVESLRNSWASIAANLHQIDDYLVKCRHVLQSVGDSPEKEVCLTAVEKAEFEIKETLAQCVVVMGALKQFEKPRTPFCAP